MMPYASLGVEGQTISLIWYTNCAYIFAKWFTPLRHQLDITFLLTSNISLVYSVQMIGYL